MNASAKKLYLAYGYVREIQKSNKLSSMVPDMIPKMLFDFAKIWDTWHDNVDKRYIKLDENNNSITSLSNDVVYNVWSAHTMNRYSCDSADRIHTWTLSIKNINKHLQTLPSPFVGIVQFDDLYNFLTYERNCGYWSSDKGYMFCGATGQLRGGKESCRRIEGTFNRAGDTLSVTVDLNKMNIRLQINGIDHGIAWDNIRQSSYRLVVGFYMLKGTEIELF